MTSYFTISYLFRAIQNYVIATAGVAAFDVGALIWDHAYNRNASNQEQRDIADAMFKVDAAGMLLTTIAYLVPADVMPPIVHELTNWIVPIVFFVNIIAGVLYQRNSDDARLGREQREQTAEINYVQNKAKNELSNEQARAVAEKAKLEHEHELLKLEQENALLQMELDAMRKGSDLAKTRGTHVEDAADGFAKKTVENFRQVFGHKIGANGNGTKPLNADVPQVGDDPNAKAH